MSYKSHSEAMMTALSHFNWNATSIVTSPTNFGINSSAEFENLATENRIEITTKI